MRTAFLAAALLLASPAAAQHAGHVTHQGGAMPSAPGQSAFAAMAEIVTLLRADPATDWARVDLDALRAHLQDMDALMLRASPRADAIPDGARFTLAPGTPGYAAARRMVPAHAPVLEAETGWSSRAQVTEAGIAWTVTDPAATAQIRALGFFGLMALGNHHPAHHVALAQGRAPH